MYQNASFRRRTRQNFSPQTPSPVGASIRVPSALAIRATPRPNFWIRACTQIITDYQKNEAFLLMKCIRRYVWNGPVITLVFV